MRTLYLGSTSPRRRQLLLEAGIAFLTARPDIDETEQPGEPAAAYVARLSHAKARAVAAAQVGFSGLILTADTTVADDGVILGKPADAASAQAMLRRLRGRAHAVHSAITLLDAQSNDALTQVVTTQVVMRAYTEGEIAAFVTSGEAFDKAGSYSIQDPQFRPVERVQGCYTNVMGLPLCAVCRLLAAHGIPVATPPPCAEDDLPCRVYPER
jgi:septum formation protein